MPRTVVNIGPLLIEESTTRSGAKVYRFFTRNATNSIGRVEHLKKIRKAIDKELVKQGVLKDGRVRLRKAARNYYQKHKKDVLEKKRLAYLRNLEKNRKRALEYYHAHKDEINALRKGKTQE